MADPALCAIVSTCEFVGPRLYQSILASMTQYGGFQQGGLIDPRTMRTFINTTAGVRALEIYAEMVRYSARGDEDECSGVHVARLLEEGRCAMTITYVGTYKRSAQPGYKFPCGIARVPGSSVVYMRESGQLVPCTPGLCFYGEAASHAAAASAGSSSQQTGATTAATTGPAEAVVVVNRAPLIGGMFAALSTLCKDGGYLEAAYDLYHDLASPARQLAAAMDPETLDATPMRYSHMEPQAVLPLLAARGYDPATAAAYLEATQKTVNTENAYMEPRLPHLDSYLVNFQRALARLFAGVPPQAVASELELEFIETMGLVEPQRLRLLYLRSLSLLGRLQQAPGSGGRAGGGTTVRAVAISVAIGLAAALALAIYMWYARRRDAHRGLLGQVKAPGPGPETTLVVTDIEGSTQMMETLPMDVMEEAIRLHHELLRATAHKHGG